MCVCITSVVWARTDVNWAVSETYARATWLYSTFATRTVPFLRSPRLSQEFLAVVEWGTSHLSMTRI